MSRFADIRAEWRVEEIERNVRGKAESHELSTLRSDMDRLEHSLRESRAEVDGLRSQFQAMQDQIERLLQNENA